MPVPNPKMAWAIMPNQTSDWRHLMEAWLYRDSLVVATDVDTVAYDRMTGRPKWTFKPPVDVPGRALFCGASPAVSRNRIALAYGSETQNRFAACTNVTVLDLDTGKVDWQARLGEPREGMNGAPTEAFLDFLGDTLLVGWGAYLITHRMSDGAQLSKNGLKHDSSRPNCEVRDLLGDKVVARCLGVNVPDLSLATVDRSGKFVTVRDFTRQTAGRTLATGRFVATDPLLLWVVDNERPVKADYLVLGNDLAIRHTIPGANLAMDDLGPGNTVGGHRSPRAIVAGQTLITVTIPFPGKVNKLVAYDLATGRLRWEAQAPNARILMPVAVDGSSIISVADTGTATTIRFNLENGSVESLTPHPRDDASSTLHSFRYFWAGQRVYAVGRRYNPGSIALFTLG